MPETERCELHDAVLATSSREPDAFRRWSRTPIGDECQHCSVCRTARLYIERRLAERGGRRPPPGESAEDAWRELQTSLSDLRSSIHHPS